MSKFFYQNPPMYAIAGGGGGGSFTQLDTPLDALVDGDSSGDNNNQNRGDGELSIDPDKILSQLFGSDDPADGETDSEEDDSTDDSIGDKPPKKKKAGATEDDNVDDSGEAAASKAMAEKLALDLGSLTIPADFLPADFDPTNREHLSTAFTNIQRSSTSNALKLIFPIIDRALQAQRTNLTAEIGKQIAGTSGEARIQQALEAAIPEATDPAMAALVKTLFSQARKRHDKAPEAIAATKQALHALGIKLGSGSQDGTPAGVLRSRNRQGSGNANTLDAFFAMPAPKPGNAATRRMSNDRR